MWTCVRTYEIKHFRQRGHNISQISVIYLELRRLAVLFFVDNADLPEQGNSTSKVQEKLQNYALICSGGIRATGGTLRNEKFFCCMANFYWAGGKCKYRKITSTLVSIPKN